MQVQHFLAMLFMTVALSLAVKVHAANCTTHDKLDVTCTHPKVPSIVMLVLNGTMVNSMESSTGITVFSVAYLDTVNVSISCCVNHTICNSTPSTVDEQGKQCVRPVFIVIEPTV